MVSDRTELIALYSRGCTVSDKLSLIFTLIQFNVQTMGQLTLLYHLTQIVYQLKIKELIF